MFIKPSEPAPMQRVSGVGRLAVKHLDGRSSPARLYQEGAARIRMSRLSPGGTLEAVPVDTPVPLSGKRAVYGFRQ